MENIYSVSAVNLQFPNSDNGAYKIELSKDNQIWETLVTQDNISNKRTLQNHVVANKIVGRFLE
jgi:hypothetical protein